MAADARACKPRLSRSEGAADVVRREGNGDGVVSSKDEGFLRRSAITMCGNV